MSQHLSYVCDQCKEPVTEIYGALTVKIGSEKHPEFNATNDFCSMQCFLEWVKELTGERPTTTSKDPDGQEPGAI